VRRVLWRGKTVQSWQISYTLTKKPAPSNYRIEYLHMTKTEVVITTHFDKASEKIEVHFHSRLCGEFQSSELWVGMQSGRFIMVHQAAYYDEKLLKRRSEGNMLSGWSPVERMLLVGQVWKASPDIGASKILLGQSSIEAEIYDT
jgi:hypothetical protein